jgi:hypothetical protein
MVPHELSAESSTHVLFIAPMQCGRPSYIREAPLLHCFDVVFISWHGRC